MTPTFGRQPLRFPAAPPERIRGRCGAAALVAADATIAERTFLDIARIWGQSTEPADVFFQGHCTRVAEHAAELATALRMDARTRMTVVAGAYLHGVGRTRVPRAVHNKPVPLTPEERLTVEQIPVWGTEILAKANIPWDVAPIVRWHNERADGTGYPDALRGDEIPLAAQIVGIANVFDALTSPRPHRPALTPPQAVRAVSRSAESWSPELFHTYLHQLQARYPGSLRLA
jgi:HD-GYP domain-containing protein (c-di-GMP phosphodiesterase class II)